MYLLFLILGDSRETYALTIINNDVVFSKDELNDLLSTALCD